MINQAACYSHTLKPQQLLSILHKQPLYANTITLTTWFSLVCVRQIGYESAAFY